MVKRPELPCLDSSRLDQAARVEASSGIRAGNRNSPEEIRCQFIIRGGNPVSVHHSCPKKINRLQEIRCQFIIRARKD